MAGGRVATNNFAEANWIVDYRGLQYGATHTTLTAALADASSGDVIHMRPGTYIEDPVMKNNVMVTGTPQSRAQTIIKGKISNDTTASSYCRLSHLSLKSNGDYALSFTGSNTNFLGLLDCYIEGIDNDAILNSNSSASSILDIRNCQMDVSGAYKYFDLTGTGITQFYYCQLNNGPQNTTASTISAGTLKLYWTECRRPITTSGTSGLESRNSYFFTTDVNATNLTIGGSGTNYITNSTFRSGTASSISTSQTLSLYNCSVDNSNASAIAGAGTLNYANLSLPQTASISTTTTSPKDYFQNGTWTPTIAGSSTAGTPTYTVQVGEYTRIGDVCMAFFRVQWTAWGGTPAGNFRLQGLPFTAKTASTSDFWFFPVDCSNLNWSGTGGQLIGTVANAQTYCQFSACQDNVTVSAFESVSIYSSGTAFMRGAIVYKVA